VLGCGFHRHGTRYGKPCSCLQRFVDFQIHSYLAHADLDEHEDVGWWLHIPIVPSRGPLIFC